MNINVDHHEGLVFVKHAAETGITYVPVDVTEIEHVNNNLLVRHGDHTTGNCGYYPLWLLMADEAERKHHARLKSKRPPGNKWVERSKALLAEAGAKFIH